MCRAAPAAGASIGAALVTAAGITATGYVVLSIAAFVIFVLTTALAVFVAGAALYVGFELLDLVPAWRSWRDGWWTGATVLALRRTARMVKVQSVRAASAPAGELPPASRMSILPTPETEPHAEYWAPAREDGSELDPVGWAAANLRTSYPHLVLRSDRGGSR